MNQRMMIGAVVLLIAASGVIPKASPEMAPLAGSYTLLLSRPTADQRVTLVLVKDGSAKLTTEALGEKPASTTQMGMWTVESGAVNLALTASSGAGQRQMALNIQGDSLVGTENNSPEGGESWTFQRK